MVVEPVPLVAGVVSFVPGLLAVFALYAPYDGFFRDNVVFLWFIGGLLVGTPIAILNEFVIVGAAPVAFILGAPVIEQGAKLVFLNRPRWQGERHAIWNGGAMGAGMSAMLILIIARQSFAVAFDAVTITAVAALAAGLGLVHVATGLGLGWGVREGRPWIVYLLTAAVTVPAAFLVFGTRFFTVGRPGLDNLLFPVALAVYGLTLLVYARRRWLPEALGPEEMKRMRRERRRGGP